MIIELLNSLLNDSVGDPMYSQVYSTYDGPNYVSLTDHSTQYKNYIAICRSMTASEIDEYSQTFRGQVDLPVFIESIIDITPLWNAATTIAKDVTSSFLNLIPIRSCSGKFIIIYTGVTTPPSIGDRVGADAGNVSFKIGPEISTTDMQVYVRAETNWRYMYIVKSATVNSYGTLSDVSGFSLDAIVTRYAELRDIKLNNSRKEYTAFVSGMSSDTNYVYVRLLAVPDNCIPLLIIIGSTYGGSGADSKVPVFFTYAGVNGAAHYSVHRVYRTIANSSNALHSFYAEYNIVTKYLSWYKEWSGSYIAGPIKITVIA